MPSVSRKHSPGSSPSPSPPARTLHPPSPVSVMFQETGIFLIFCFSGFLFSCCIIVIPPNRRRMRCSVRVLIYTPQSPGGYGKFLFFINETERIQQYKTWCAVIMLVNKINKKNKLQASVYFHENGYKCVQVQSFFLSFFT